MQIREGNEKPKVECLSNIENEQIKEGIIYFPTIQFKNIFNKKTENSFFNIFIDLFTRWDQIETFDENFKVDNFFDKKSSFLCEYQPELHHYFPDSFFHYASHFLLCYRVSKKDSISSHFSSLPKGV